MQIEADNLALQNQSKIKMLEDHLKEEVKSREEWVQKYLEEQKKEVEATSDLMNVRTEFKEMSLQFQDTRIRLHAALEDLKKKNSDILKIRDVQNQTYIMNETL